MSAAPDPVELTQALVRINSVNPPGDEDECARSLGALLQGAGFEVSYHAFAPRRTSLVARLGGAPSRAPICFTGHIDTVPLGAAPWSHDPFGAEIIGGRLYGRGSSDMKSGVAAFTTAAVGLAPRLAGTAGVVLVITAGEETGCDGAYHLARASGALGDAGAVVVAEPTANYPLVGHKGVMWLEARTRGLTAHGSMPERGENAVYKAARAVSALEAFAFDAPAHPLMGSPTLSVGTIRGGLNVNSVPDECVIGIDIRTVPDMDPAALRGRLAARLGPDVELYSVLQTGSVYTEPHGDWVQEVFGIMAPILGEAPQPRCVPYFTDAAALREAWPAAPTLILGPGEPHMAHQTDEYCEVERIRQAADAYGRILASWCGLA